jgi:transcription initiation factor IIF auxiliary subunit
MAGVGNTVYIKHDVNVPPNKSEEEIESNFEYYPWRIYVDGTPAALAKIDHVEYVLHPSFPRPVITTSDSAKQFSYEVMGYGSFDLTYKIYLKTNPNIPISGRYRLNISQSNHTGVPVDI